MRCVIVHESMFGNTERFAEVIGDTLERAGSTVDRLDVRSADPSRVAGCDLLVVGAPTHAFSLSRPATRRDAVQQGADPSRASMGVREWLALLDGAYPSASGRPVVAVFDTRVDRARRWPGSAARRAARVLRAQGFSLALEPTSFYVDDTSGPPSSGEVDRARAWATVLAHAAPRTAS